MFHGLFSLPLRRAHVENFVRLFKEPALVSVDMMGVCIIYIYIYVYLYMSIYLSVYLSIAMF